MALMSDYLENKLANHVFRNHVMTSPEDVWLGLFYDDPKDQASQLELTGKGYQRERIVFDSPKNGVIKNAEEIIFHKATSVWREVTHVAIFNQEKGGHILFHGLVTDPVIIPKNKNFVLKVGDLQAGFE